MFSISTTNSGSISSNATSLIFTLPRVTTTTTSAFNQVAAARSHILKQRKRPDFYDDRIIAKKIAQKFERKLKISEKQSALVEQTIERRKKEAAGSSQLDSEQKPQSCGSGSATQKLIEKLRQKERDQLSKALKTQPNQQRLQIDHLIDPAQRKQFQFLEQQVRQKEQVNKQAFQAKLDQEERERQRRLEEQQRRIAEAKAKADREAAEKRAAEEAAAKAKAEAEQRKKKQEEEAAKKRELDEQKKKELEEERKKKEQEEEKKGGAEPAAGNGAGDQAPDIVVPDLSSSLLDQAVLQGRQKKYLKPCPELSAQMKQQVEAWTKFENDMKALRADETLLDKDFYQRYPDGTQEKITKTEEAITRVANTITRPEQGLTDQQKEGQLQQYADVLIQRIMALNTEFDHNEKVVKFGIYKMVVGFAANKFVSQAKHKLTENRKQGLEEFLIKIYDKLHYQLPQLCLKEMVMGFFASRNMLFYPKNAQPEDVQNNEAKLIEQRGFRLKGGKKESIEETIGRLQIHAVIFFSLHLSDAYIGRLFLTLSTLLCLKHTQNQAGVILHLLDVGGQRLMLTYKRAFADQLRVIKNEFCPSFRRHIQAADGLQSEPQNQAKYLSQPEPGQQADFGQRETTLELDKLERLANDLLGQAAQRNF